MATLSSALKLGAGGATALVQAKVLAHWDKFAWEFISTDFFVKQLYNSLNGVAKNP
jgi:hypothetical protein